MFKKPFAVQAQNLLSKKDVKTLRSKLGEAYLALEEKVLDDLLPEGQVKVYKCDNKALLYGIGDAPPSFFDAEGRGDVGDIFPTLTTLWQHPYLMPELTIHPEVSKFVLNGADLMLPGVIVPANGVAGFGTVKKGQARCIKIDGNPYPIAVGRMIVNQSQMEKLKGKGLEVCHVFRDTLWAHCGKQIPNAGFTEKEDEVVPCAEKAFVLGGAPADAAASPPAAETSAVASSEPPAFSPPDRVAAAQGSTSVSTGDAAPTSGGAGAGKAPEEWSQDDLLDFCFVMAFTSTLADDKALPIEASDLYEKHMKPRRPDGTTLDVKKSSHKQIGKYLNTLRKSKVIDVVDKKNVISVTKVDRQHRDFLAFQTKFKEEAQTSVATAAEKGGAPSDAGSKGLPPPVITTLWKSSHYLEGIFKTMGKKKDDLFTWDQAREVLASYIKKEGLGSGDKGLVKLNEDLLNALVKSAGGQKKDATFPEEMDFEELAGDGSKLEERMVQHTSIEVAGVGSTVRKGEPQQIEVTLSRKGAHNVTRICNLEAYGLDVAAMGEELKKKFNCTVNIEDMPGKNSKDKMLQFQGHVDREVAEYLLLRYGITKKFLSVK